MNILNIIQCTNLGGMEQANLLVMQHFLHQGHKVRVISRTPAGEGAALYERAGIPVLDCEYRGTFGLLSHHKLRALVRSTPADLVIVTGPSITSCLTARIHPVPHILWSHYHIGRSLADRLIWMMVYALWAQRFDKIIFCSDFIRLEAASVYPPLNRKSITVRNIFEDFGEGESHAKAVARQRLGLPENAPIIGNAGWLIKRKRFDILLQVAQLIRQEIPDLHVVIAGGGELEHDLRQMANSLGLQGHVHWLGWLSDLRDFYQSLDVLVFNSDADAFGRSPIEAMSFAVPAVASLVYGGLKEAIIHQRTGFIIDHHDVAQLAAYTTYLLTNDNFRKAMGENGKQWVKDNLNAKTIGAQIDDVLNELVMPDKFHYKVVRTYQ
jgi:L-malate glycosyltransferase